MEAIIQFVTNHTADALIAGSAMFTLGGLAIKLTPTKTDDAWWNTYVVPAWSKIKGWLGG